MDITVNPKLEHTNHGKTEQKQQNQEIREERVKYRLEGLTCAACAMKIEKAFCAEETIGQTSLSFATQTVYLPLAAQELAQRIVDRIEPGVNLKPVNQGGSKVISQQGDSQDTRWKKLRMLVAGTLLALGLLLTMLGQNPSWLLEYTIYLSAYILVGYEVLYLAMRNMVRGAPFDENFLMSLATIGAIAINQLPEAVGVMLFYTVGEYIQDLAVNRSRHSIQALMNIRPDYANLIHQLDVLKVEPEDVQVGQLILVRPGERVPLMGKC